MLLRGDVHAAVEHLREAATAQDPAALSDLAAALVSEAEELDAWEPTLDAIVSARRAIARDPSLAAAHFNLALALERIGLVAQARGAFDAAARLEPNSPWAAEARTRADALPHRTPNAWKAIEQQLDKNTNPAKQRAVVLSDPHLARVYAEGPYLTSWAEAWIAGARDIARASLERSRVIAMILSETSGERLALDAVTAIDRAQAAGMADTIAREHVAYLQGRLARKDGDNRRATVLLLDAADALARVSSPLQHVARYYAAGALYEQGRIDEAYALLESLDAENLAARGYRGLAVQLGWERGICLEVRGQYAEAVGVFDRSRAAALALGEHDLVARFDGLAAEALEYLGESRQAWLRRSRALRAYAVSGRVDSRTAIALTSTAQLRMAARDWKRAAVLLDYAVPLAADADNAIVSAQALAKRSVVRDALLDADGASDDRAMAAAWARKLPTGVRERLNVELQIAEGVARRASAPQGAIAHFTTAIEILSRRGQTSLLPRLYLERARAREAIGDHVGACRDLQAGIDVVARWERAVFSLEQRAALSVWGDAMRRDLIALELAAGDVAAAFAHADARYTAVTGDAWRRSSLREVQHTLAHDAAILELTIVRGAIVGFLIRSDDARAYRVPVAPARLMSAANVARERNDAQFLAAAATLYAAIVAPIREHLEGVTTLAVIPEGELTAIPFGALRHREDGHPLLQDMSVVHASSAAAAVASSRRAQEAHDGTVTTIGSDAFDRNRYPDIQPLPYAGREAAGVAEVWPVANAWFGHTATAERLRREFPGAAVIHYAGHIIGRGADARFVLAPGATRDTVSAREIASLPLRARVVVLAGCRGAGVSAPQSIVSDMASGFLAAGAATVIASASDIDDEESMRTMRRLHSFLSEGADPADAARRTALLDLQEGRRSVPLSLRLIVYGGTRFLLRASEGDGRS
jgi:CHAT domain-containing protein